MTMCCCDRYVRHTVHPQHMYRGTTILETSTHTYSTYTLQLLGSSVENKAHFQIMDLRSDGSSVKNEQRGCPGSSMMVRSLHVMALLLRSEMVGCGESLFLLEAVSTLWKQREQ